MTCLRCGWCCRNIWPENNNDNLEVPQPCPDLIQVEGTIATCRIYPDRPQRCKDEHMGTEPGEMCPIGLRALERGKIPRPVGKCTGCGNPYWSGEHTPLCSTGCRDDRVAELNTFIKRGCKDEE